MPRWARVAFAARCARRVQPLLLWWANAPAHVIDRVDAAIEFSEGAAAGANYTERARADAYASAAFEAADCQAAGAGYGYAAAARAAAEAAYAATAARSEAARGAPGTAETPHAAAAVAAAAEAAGAAASVAFAAELGRALAVADGGGALAAAVAGDDIFGVAVRRDFDQLLSNAARDGWTPQTPVSPSVFGPMWLGGEAPEWTSEARPTASETSPGRQELVLGVTVGDFTPTELASEKLLELLGAINAYHIAAGGDGLQFDDMELFRAADVPAGVPS